MRRDILTLNFPPTILTFRSCYSAHEYTHLLSSKPASAGALPSSGAASGSVRLPALTAPSPTLSISSLPPDITIEVLISLFLLTLGIVLSSEPLKPIRWNEWAALVEHGQHGPDSKYLKTSGDCAEKTTEELGQQLYGGPSQEGYGYLENGRRMGFFDIRARRKEFADWVKKGGKEDVKKQ